MGLFKDVTMYNTIKDSTALVQDNILARKDEFRLIGHIIETDIPTAVKALLVQHIIGHLEECPTVIMSISFRML